MTGPSATGRLLFSPLVEDAIELAAEWHDATYRKSRWRDPAFSDPEGRPPRVPAMAHVTAVAFTVERAGWDDATVAAAFVHDVVEDENRYGAALTLEEIAARLGPEVAARVAAVTERKYDDDGTPRSWEARKREYVEQIRSGPPEAAAVSLADKLHNLYSMNESLARGLDIFAAGPGRRALSAGPTRQVWYHRAVLEATRPHDDPRLVPMRARLEEELHRFERLAAAS